MPFGWMCVEPSVTTVCLLPFVALAVDRIGGSLPVVFSATLLVALVLLGSASLDAHVIPSERHLSSLSEAARPLSARGIGCTASLLAAPSSSMQQLRLAGEVEVETPLSKQEGLGSPCLLAARDSAAASESFCFLMQIPAETQMWKAAGLFREARNPLPSSSDATLPQ